MIDSNYVIIDKKGNMVRFGNGLTVVYGSENEAKEDMIEGDRAVKLRDLEPDILKEILLNNK